MGDDNTPLPATNVSTGQSGLPVVADLRPTITAIRCSENRTVFTEEENEDGWLSTDLTVDVER